MSFTSTVVKTMKIIFLLQGLRILLLVEANCSALFEISEILGFVTENNGIAMFSYVFADRRPK